MENEQHKPIGIPTGGTSLSINNIIKEYEAKGIDVVVMGGGEDVHEFIKRNLGEEGVKVVVIEDIDQILKGKNLSDELEVLKNPPIPIKNFRQVDPLHEIFIENKKKPWESQRRVKKFKNRGGR